MERATIREMSEAVIGELERLGYASGTIKSYQRLYQKLLRGVSIQGITAGRISEFFRSQIELDSRTVATITGCQLGERQGPDVLAFGALWLKYYVKFLKLSMLLPSEMSWQLYITKNFA